MMNCIKCGANWEARIRVDNCPFCGAPLTTEDNSFSGILSKLIEQNGEEVLYSRRYVAILKDLLPDELVKCKLMSIVIETGVGKYIADTYKSPEISWKSLSQNAIRRLNEQAFLDKEKAELIVQEIGASINANSVVPGQTTPDVSSPVSTSTTTDIMSTDEEEEDIITLTFDDDTAVDCYVMGTFELNGKEYIALEPQDGTGDVYIYGYKQISDDEFEICEIGSEEEFDAVSAEFDAIMKENDNA